MWSWQRLASIFFILCLAGELYRTKIVLAMSRERPVGLLNSLRIDWDELGVRPSRRRLRPQQVYSDEELELEMSPFVSITF